MPKLSFDEQLKCVKKDTDTKVTLFKEVFKGEQGKLLLEYLEYKCKAKADFDNEHRTYYGLGQRDVVKYIKTILEQGSRERTKK